MLVNRVVITGAAYHVPERIITNEEIERRINTTSEFIESRTGVLERRHARAEETLADLIEPAATRAIQDAGLTAEDIDMLIINTLSPDHHDPSEACLMQHRLGLRRIPSFDIRAQCSGLLYGMDIAAQYIRTGTCAHVLVICAELLSKRLDVSDRGRNVSIMLGDGAGAVVLSAMPPSPAANAPGLVDLISHADGAHYSLMCTEAPGTAQRNFVTEADVHAGRHYFRMQGRPFRDQIVAAMTSVVLEILANHGLTMADIHVVIPHQANLRILECLERNLDIPDGRLVKTIERFGNMASASMSVTLALAREQGRFTPGALALLVGCGSGMTWGAALYRC
ncbi:3-oxoacyl-ACP synthase III family protein [Nocardia gamkensis]|uniref:3-oxoacyl-ACP synthase III family protein n=1 Tax=Nocardia gamkensis TaxID=352869 RepID=UPI0036E0B1F8